MKNKFLHSIVILLIASATVVFSGPHDIEDSRIPSVTCTSVQSLVVNHTPIDFLPLNFQRNLDNIQLMHRRFTERVEAPEAERLVFPSSSQVTKLAFIGVLSVVPVVIGYNLFHGPFSLLIFRVAIIDHYICCGVIGLVIKASNQFNIDNPKAELVGIGWLMSLAGFIAMMFGDNKPGPIELATFACCALSSGLIMHDLLSTNILHQQVRRASA